MTLRASALLIALAIAGTPALYGCSSRGPGAGRGQAGNIHLTSGGRDRTYSVHVPSNLDTGRPAPLVIAYHGHGSNGPGQEDLSHMSRTADDNGFIIAYPDGVNGSWNDGRASQASSGVDDIGFTRDLIKKVSSEHRIDPARIYATGMSNGGMFCYRLALEMPETFSAIAPVSALMSEEIARRPGPSRPVSVMMTAGESDRLMPYRGGRVGLFRGTVLSADATMDYWVKADGCTMQEPPEMLTDNDPADGTRTRKEAAGGGAEGSEVLLYTVEGGGHAWPGGLQYARLVRTSRDWDASQAIWDFFSRHTR